MLLNVGKLLLPVALVVSLTTIAKADDIYTYSVNYTSSIADSPNSPITVSGTISVGVNGLNTYWDGYSLTFNSNALLGFPVTLTPANSTFTVAPSTAAQFTFDQLWLILANSAQGFEFDGTGTDSQEYTYEVLWQYGDGLANSLATINVPGRNIVNVAGSAPFTFPQTITFDRALSSPSAVPEPASFLLIGSGAFPVVVSCGRRLQRGVDEPVIVNSALMGRLSLSELGGGAV